MSFMNRVLSKDTVLLGKKKAEVKKLTPALWKKVFGAIDLLPGVALQVFSAPRKDLSAYLLQAFDVALEEMLEIVSLVSDIDKEYLYHNAGLDELIEYVYLTIKKNRLDQTAKNLKGLLKQPQAETPTE
ncbi:hypothetical protein QT711_11240 [Sporosarcina saromensis]|uniref:Uncharacterized protein n=1 Tax=Sporosarcina saromensis TaxID=359365 RepID=A0ABU4GBL5_9BACL|nr:hypothetical protein [Sporosarcina saromensis]MDW0113762.1 hypothetical protein [Sporosarcina saromensis]